MWLFKLLRERYVGSIEENDVRPGADLFDGTKLEKTCFTRSLAVLQSLSSYGEIRARSQASSHVTVI